MRWVLLDVVLALLAVGLLVLVGLRLWRQTRALAAAVAVAGGQLETVGAQLESVGGRDRSFADRSPAGHREQARERPGGVRSTRSS